MPNQGRGSPVRSRSMFSRSNAARENRAGSRQPPPPPPPNRPPMYSFPRPDLEPDRPPPPVPPPHRQDYHPQSTTPPRPTPPRPTPPRPAPPPPVPPRPRGFDLFTELFEPPPPPPPPPPATFSFGTEPRFARPPSPQTFSFSPEPRFGFARPPSPPTFSFNTHSHFEPPPFSHQWRSMSPSPPPPPTPTRPSPQPSSTNTTPPRTHTHTPSASSSNPPTLDDMLEMPADRIPSLSISALKSILATNHVNAGMVLEKSDLVLKVRHLIDEERSNRERQRVAEEAEELDRLERERERELLEGRHQQRDQGYQMPSGVNGSPASEPSSDPTQKPIPKPAPSALDRDGLCVVCYDSEANIAIVDCGSVCPLLLRHIYFPFVPNHPPCPFDSATLPCAAAARNSSWKAPANARCAARASSLNLVSFASSRPDLSIAPFVRFFHIFLWLLYPNHH